MTSVDTPLLEVRDLSVTFGRRQTPGVTQVGFTLRGGERLGLIGESGCGKTVTALAIMGLLPDSATVRGSIRWQGRELVGLRDEDYAKLRGDAMTLVFQEPMTALDPTMRVGMQVAEVLRLHYARARDAARYHADAEHIVDDARGRVLAILAAVGVADPQRVAASFPHELSGGQGQRVMIAMALINRPQMVIFDEATTALDVTVQARVLHLINAQLSVTGAGCLFISHDLAVVSQVCSQVIVMLGGRIIEAGALAQVFAEPHHPYTRGLVSAARLDAAQPGERLPELEGFAHV